MTPQEAARRLARFRAEYPNAVLRGLRKGTRAAVKLALTKYMERKNKDPRVDPPNPPPGPLAIRTGKLARTVDIVEPKLNGSEVTAGLKMGGSGVPYGAIHEKGGWAGRGLRSYIPPRPVLRPSLDETDVTEYVRVELSRVARSILGALWTGAA